MNFDIQVNPGIKPWNVIADAARAADDAGFRTFWTMDHLRGATMQAPTMPECFTQLGAIAAITSRINVGPLVVNVGNRNAGLLANASATLQEVSNGRHVLGLGAGGGPNNSFAIERTTLGMVPPATMRERHAVLATTLDLLDAMWSSQRDSTYDTYPLPDPRPEVVIGVNSVSLAKLAGERADGVNIRATSDVCDDALTAAIEAHENSGRTDTFDVSVWDFFSEDLLSGKDPRLDRWVELGVTTVVLLMFDDIDIAAISRSEKWLR
ncbi:MAG: hypothetical protein RLZ84_473 [Actinomycetota bacterium]